MKYHLYPTVTPSSPFSLAADSISFHAVRHPIPTRVRLLRVALLAGLVAFSGEGLVASAGGHGGSLQLQGLSATGAVEYSIGGPTGDEQYMVELINRARANPTAEGQRLRAATDPLIIYYYTNVYQVDLALMVAQFTNIAPVAPLSINAILLGTARAHSLDQVTHPLEGTTGSDGSAWDTRMTKAGYVPSTSVELAYAFVQSPMWMHTFFEVDWGTGPGTVGGMLSPPGHRQIIHFPDFTELGLGLVRTNLLVGGYTVGPLILTEDFAAPTTSRAFITGVAYYDLDGDGFYTPGEGIGGLLVSVSGAGYYAVTGNSGGYSVPVPGNGNYTVTFSGPGMDPFQTNVTVRGLSNVKVDFIPSYQPPALLGTNVVVFGRTNILRFSPVPGATAYRWQQLRHSLTNVFDGAEAGLVNFTAHVGPGYDVVDVLLPYDGANSFRLLNTDGNPQVLEFNSSFQVDSNSAISFEGRVGYGTTNQVAHVQLSFNQGESWVDVWSLQGSGKNYGRWTNNVVSLQAYAGQQANLRFNYDLISATNDFYSVTNVGVGFYFDDVTLTNIEVLVGQETSDLGTNQALVFIPPTAGQYNLQVQAQVSGQWLPWGPYRVFNAVSTATPTATTQIDAVHALPNNQMEIDFTVTSGFANSFGLASATEVTGPWTPDSVATAQAVSAQHYTIVAQIGTAARQFYRIQTR